MRAESPIPINVDAVDDPDDEQSTRHSCYQQIQEDDQRTWEDENYAQLGREHFVEQYDEDEIAGTTIEGTTDLIEHLRFVMSAPAASSGDSIYRLGTCRIIWNALDDDVRLHLENANFRLERKDQLACMVDTRGEAADLASQIIGRRIKETSTLPEHLWQLMQAA